ncbi:MAG: cytochrome C oxidase subunit IV family protein [Rubritalea sp.]|jgi:caa(3)-type oxidase subunit IV
MADSPEAIKKSIKLYTFIGLLLFIFTGITVAVATVPALDFGEHGFDHVDAIIGICIASFKAGLVAFIFMHLNHEKKAIYWIFCGAIALAVTLILLFAFHYFDPITFDELLPGGVTQ